MILAIYLGTFLYILRYTSSQSFLEICVLIFLKFLLRLFLRSCPPQLRSGDLNSVQREADRAEERGGPLLCLDHQGQRGYSRQDTGHYIYSTFAVHL